ncbi:MAG: hypothetical protein ACETVX_00190, partial [bacterium]
PLPKPIYFYFNKGVGGQVRFTDTRDPVVSWRHLIADDNPNLDVFFISLAGFETTVLTERRSELKPFVERIRVIQQSTPLGMFRIIFDWSKEPPVHEPDQSQDHKG